VREKVRAGAGDAGPLLKISSNGFSDSTPEIAKQARRDGRRPRTAAERPHFRLLLRAEPGIDATRALRWALKQLLRKHGLRCTSIEQVQP
jgi:hypothetical protein